MKPTTVEQLFERFVQRGDAAALAEVFDRTAPEVLRVAQHLSRDLTAAEDLLQATFVAAIEARASWDAARPLVPWLLGIVALQAKKQAAARARRPDVRRLRQPASIDPSDAAAEVEFTEALQRAVDGTSEPYRQILVLHLRHGLSPTEIGDVLGRAPATVRSQLARGLRLVRRALPAGFSAAALTVLTGRGVAAVRRAVLVHARVLVPAAGTGLVAGVVVMKKAVAVLVVLALSALLGFLIVPQLGRAGPTPPASLGELAGEPPVVAAHSGEVAGRALGDDVAPERVEQTDAPPPEVEPRGSLLVRLVWDDDLEPAVGVPAYAISWRQTNRLLHARPVTSDADGIVRFPDLVPGPTTISTYSNVKHRVDLPAGAPTEVQLPVPRGLTIAGEVVDPSGAPVPFAEIWVTESGGRRDGVAVAESDSNGCFRVSGIHEVSWLGARKRGYSPSTLRVAVICAEAGGERRARLVLGGPAAAVRGRVVGPDDHGVGGALVEIELRDLSTAHVAADGKREFAPCARRLWTRADGAFAADDLPPGATTIRVRAADLVPIEREVELTAGAAVELQFELRRGVTLTGRITDDAGAALRDVGVYHGDPAAGRFDRSTATVDARGEYRLGGLPPGELVVEARGSGYGTVRHRFAAADGDTVRWDPRFSSGRTIRGFVVDHTGEPLVGWTVTAAGERGEPGSVDTGADGAFAIGNRLDEPHVVEVRDRSLGSQPPIAMITGVKPGDSGVELRVAEQGRALGRVVARVFTPDGEPFDGLVVVRARYRAGRIPVAIGVLGEQSGEWQIDRLPPRDYTIVFDAPGYPVHRVRDCRVGPGETVVLPAVQLAHGGDVEVELVATDGFEPTGAVGTLSGSSLSGSIELEPGGDGVTLRSRTVPPGTYVVRVAGADFAPHEAPVTVSSRQTARARIELRRSPSQRLVFSVPPGRPFPARVEVTVFDAADRVVRRAELFSQQQRALAWTLGLPIGSYRIEAQASTGASGGLGFRVAPGAPPEPLSVPLR